MKSSRVWTAAVACAVACGDGTGDGDGDGTTTNIDVTEYDQSCVASEDCVVVKNGDICCGCPDAAINRKDLDRYQGDLGECEAVCDIGCVGTYVGFCDQGKCIIRNEDEQVCEPGSTALCACGSMMNGMMLCRPDGSGYDDCVC